MNETTQTKMVEEKNGETAEEMQELDRAPETGGSKPSFEKITALTIKEAVFRIDKTKTNKDRKNREYFPFWLAVTYVDDKGNESYESYGGGHRYKETDWIGKKSALGELKALAGATFDYDGTWAGLVKAIAGQKVGVLTVDRQGTKKNLIQHFK